MTETRNCQNCKKDFVIEQADFDFYKKIDVPAPTFCPECRYQRRLAARNERSLYRGSCDMCKKNILSMYAPDKGLTVYCRECWYSDNWDPLSYGRDYDFNRNFFVQFQELRRAVPQMAFYHINVGEGCEFSNFVLNSKNVYLGYSVVAKSENVMYSRNIDTGRDIVDSVFSVEGERLYEDVDGSRNYNSRFLRQTRDSLNSLFLFDCSNCQDCFMSSNLRNKQYVFRNQQFTKEEYRQKFSEINTGSYRELVLLKAEYAKMVDGALHEFANMNRCVDCTGNNLENVKGGRLCFDVRDGENIRYAVRTIQNSKDCYDTWGVGNGELCYDGLAHGFGAYNCKFNYNAAANQNAIFSDFCMNCNNVFASVAVRKKDYCIFNKQYSKEEFEVLSKKIIAHMSEVPYVDKKGRVYKYGEFFPVELSQFDYNETVAQEFFPLTKEQALEQGYSWREDNKKEHAVTMTADALPDDIVDVNDGITQDVIECSHKGVCDTHQCVKAFKVTPGELNYYRQWILPIPRLCPNCRNQERMALRNPQKLWHRQCMCEKNHSDHSMVRCPNEFETSYAPERKEMVYCESCYNAEVV